MGDDEAKNQHDALKAQSLMRSYVINFMNIAVVPKKFYVC